MIGNFLKVIVRYLSRSPFFTLLNIAGLSVGMACSIMIFLFIRHELSYDNFHRNRDQIYRVTRQSRINGMPYNIGITAAPFAPALQEEYPGRIAAVTRALSFNSLLAAGEKSFLEDRLLLADSNFFRFFSFPLAKGDPATVLKDAHSIVLSKEVAAKYFGQSDPIGKMIRMDDQYDMVVTGILDDLPGQSHLLFDAVGSLQVVAGEEWLQDWWANAFNTYVNVNSLQDVAYLNDAFPAFMEKFFGKDFERVGNKIGLRLEPLRDIYFNYDTRYETNIAHGDRKYVFIFASVGLLLLVLAAINYINLATAQGASRAREVGIRKALGSSRRSIAARFLAQSFVLCAVSLAAAVVLAQIAIPLLNQSFGLAIPGLADHPVISLFALGMLVAISVASGAYPSLQLASFKPARVLKGNVKGDLRYLFIRKALVIFQFGMSGFMIMATLLIGHQLTFMQEKDLGFLPAPLVVVRLNNGEILRHQESLRNKLLETGAFSGAAFTSGHPGGFYDATTVDIQGEEQNMRMRTLWTDAHFAGTMELPMAAGRYFSDDFPADTSASVVLNETAVRQLGWTPGDALGKKVMLSQFDTVYKEVVGVVKDFHFTSLKQQIEPLIISYLNHRGQLLVRMSGSDVRGAVRQLEDVWNSYETGFPADFVFLDDVMGTLYAREVLLGKVFSLLSVVSVVIACLGVLGLAAFIAASRTKEIGIRKVLGASAGQVSFLLMKDLLALVLVANVLAIPAAAWAMEQWLQGFAYRVGLHPGVFAAGAFAVFMLAALIVGLNAGRVASQNPVTSLRTE